MTNININTCAEQVDLSHIGWRYYNQIRKKAMEQEFSWSGFLISLSIAFFIVISAAFILSFFSRSLTERSAMEKLYGRNFYRLEIIGTAEQNNYLQTDRISDSQLIKINDFSAEA